MVVTRLPLLCSLLLLSGPFLTAQEKAVLQEPFTGAIQSLTFSADGKHLAAISNDERVRLWETQSGRKLSTLDGRGLSGVVFAPDAQTLIARGQTEIGSWSVATGKIGGAVSTSGDVSSAISPDGKIVATAGADGRLSLFSAQNGSELARLQQSARGISEVAVSADGKTIAVGAPGTITVWTGSPPTKSVLKSPSTGGLVLAGDGKLLADDQGGAIWVWEPAKGLVRCKIAARKALAFAPASQIIAVQSQKKSLTLWDVVADKALVRCDPCREWLVEARFVSGGRLMATRASDGEIKLWDVAADSPQRGKEVAILQPGVREITSLAPDGAGKYVVTGHDNGAVKKWTLATGVEEAFALRHPDPVNHVLWSKNGKYVVTRCPSFVRVWNAANGRQLGSLALPSPAVALLFAPDDALLALGLASGSVHLWNPEQPSEMPKFTAYLGATSALSLVFAGDGKTLVTRAPGREIRLWDVASRTLRAEIPSVGFTTFSPDGTTVAALTLLDQLRFWELTPGKSEALREYAQVGLPRGFYSAPLFSPDAQLLLVRGKKPSILGLYDVKTGKERLQLKGPFGAAAFSRDSKRFAVAQGKGAVAVYDAATGKKYLEFIGHLKTIRQLLFAPDGKTLTSVGDDNVALLWDLRPLAFRPRLLGTLPISANSSVSYTEDSKHLIWNTLGGALRLADVSSGKEKDPLQPVLPKASVLAATPAGQRVIAGYADGTIKLWDANPKSATFGEVRQHVDGSGPAISALALAPDGARLAAARNDGQAVLWNLGEENGPRTFALHKSQSFQLDFSADGRRLVTYAPSGVSKVVDLQSANVTSTLVAGAKGRIVVLHHHRLIVAGTDDGMVQLRDGSADATTTLQNPAALVARLAFSPDGKILASGNHNGTIKLWDVARQTELASLSGHKSRILSLDFSANGKVLLSAGNEAHVKLWDGATGTERATIELPVAEQVQLKLAPDGERLVGGGAKSGLGLWDTATGQLVRRFPFGRSAVAALVFAPDGKSLALAPRKAKSPIQLFESRTGKEHLAVENHPGGAAQVVFAPDSRTLVTTGSDNLVKVWNVETGAERFRFSSPSLASALAFRHDSEALAVGTLGGELELWDVGQRKRHLSLQKPGGRVDTVEYDATGRFLLTHHRNPGSATLWDLATNEPRHRFLECQAAALSPDDKTLALWHSNSDIKLHDLATGQDRGTVHRFVGRGAANTLAFSPTGKHLAIQSGGGDLHVLGPFDDGGKGALIIPNNTRPAEFSRDGKLMASMHADAVKVWDLASGKQLSTVTGVRLATLSPDGKWIAANTKEPALRLFDAQTGNEHTLPQELSRQTLRQLAFDPDSKLLAGLADYRTIILWDLSLAKERARLFDAKRTVSSFRFSRDGTTLASASDDGSVRVWDTRTATESLSLRNRDPHPATSRMVLAYSPDGGTLATGEDNGSLRLWHARVAREIGSLQGHAGPVHAVAVSPDGSLIATASADKTVKLWSAANRKPQATLQGHSGLVLAAAFSPGGRVLATASADRSIILWNVQTASRIAALTGHTDVVWSVAFSGDGKLLASGSSDRTIKLWNLNSQPGQATYGKLLRTLEGHEGEVFAVAFAPDRPLLVSGDGDLFRPTRPGALRFWETANGKELAAVRGHGGAIRSLAFAPDGRTLASGSWDRTVRLWPTKELKDDLRPQTTLVGHQQPVNHVVFAPDGVTLATAAGQPSAPRESGEMFLWDVRTGQLRPPLGGHRSGLTALAFAQRGASILAASFDSTVRWWALE